MRILGKSDQGNLLRAGVSRRALFALVVLLSSLAIAIHGNAQVEHPTEAMVKAAYLYNFGKFVRWDVPPPASEAFEICVLGRNPFGSTLTTTVAGEKIDGKSIVVQNIVAVPETDHCRIEFVGSSEEKSLKPICTAAKQLHLLTVSDIPGFAQHGGMIELVNQEGKIRFVVNVAAISDAGLTVSSELLKVAVRVIGTSQAREVGK